MCVVSPAKARQGWTTTNTTNTTNTNTQIHGCSVRYVCLVSPANAGQGRTTGGASGQKASVYCSSDWKAEQFAGYREAIWTEHS